MSEPIIQIEHLLKNYKIFDKPSDRVREALHPWGKRYSRDFYALRDINLEIRRGETVGIIGKNGAGKSTLLKIITGVLTPTEGKLQVHGRIASLLELGAGFNPEMTGRENLYMVGNLMGYTRGQMDERAPEIIDFADIGDFIDQPVKMYSSGMFARLAFSVNAHVSPDILIVDEALSVGDMFFQAKCINRMQQMIHSGVTILYVSHDIISMKSLCQRAIYLDHGSIVMDGKTDEVVEEYRNRQMEENNSHVHRGAAQPGDKLHTVGQREADGFGENAEFVRKSAYQRIGNGKVSFYNVRLLDESEQVIDEVTFGQTVILRMSIVVNEDLDNKVGHGYHLRDYTGQDLIYSDSMIRHSLIDCPRRGERYVVDYKFCMTVKEGPYTFACVLSIPIDIAHGIVDVCDYVPCAVQVTAVPKSSTERMHGGFVNLQDEVSSKRIAKE